MEAIAALSLAINIIQVVDWGRKVASICNDAFESRSIYPTHQKAAVNFQKATNSLQTALSSQPQEITADDQSLLDIARKCEAAAERLLKEMGPANNDKKLRLALKALSKGSTIKKLNYELAFCQIVLETRLLIDLR